MSYNSQYCEGMCNKRHGQIDLRIKEVMIYLLIIFILILSACNLPIQKEITNEQAQISITYKQAVNGYKVKVGCVSDGTYWNTASFYLNDTLRFSVEGWVDAKLFEMELKHDTIIDYIHKSADFLSAESPFYFTDIDFDGEDEFVVNLYKYGTYGSNLYVVYETDFELRKDEPFTCLQNEQCIFDSINKTITIAGKDTAYIYQGKGGHFELLENNKITYLNNGIN